MRTVGTTSRGVRCPVIREGDDLVQIVTDAILACGEEQGIRFAGQRHRSGHGGRGRPQSGQLCHDRRHRQGLRRQIRHRYGRA